MEDWSYSIEQKQSSSQEEKQSSPKKEEQSGSQEEKQRSSQEEKQRSTQEQSGAGELRPPLIKKDLATKGVKRKLDVKSVVLTSCQVG